MMVVEPIHTIIVVKTDHASQDFVTSEQINRARMMACIEA